MATTGTMASTVTFTITTLDLSAIGAYTGTIARTNLTQETTQAYDLPLEDFVVHDAPQTKLPGTAATDDLGIVGATYGTNAVYAITLDEKANGVVHSVYGRTRFTLPPEYVAGQNIQIVVVAGANTTVADTSMDVDAEACLVGTDGAVGADLVTTAAQTCNNLIAAAKTFTVNPSGRVAGDKLDIRIAIATRDNAGGDAVKGVVNRAYMALSIKG